MMIGARCGGFVNYFRTVGMFSLGLTSLSHTSVSEIRRLLQTQKELDELL